MKKIYEKPSLVAVRLESQENILASSLSDGQASGKEKIDDVGGGFNQADGNIFNWGNEDTNF